MGERGPAPRREAEVRRTNNKGKATQLTREQLDQLPFEIDYEPEPPQLEQVAPDREKWEPAVELFWEALQRDPARKWMSAADWAAAAFVAESMDRDLKPQVVGVSEEGEAVMARVPVKGANLSSYLKFLTMIGVTEASRLRIQKEVTLFPVEPVDTEGNVTDIRSARKGAVQ